jgi:hypothetical protein
MENTFPTAGKVLSRSESVGVAVSPSSNIPCPVLAYPVAIFSPLDTRCLRYALVDLRRGRTRHPWSMYRLTHECRN